MFIYTTYSFGVELSYIISYLSSLRSVPYKHLCECQQYDMDSLTLVAEVCNHEEVVQSVVHGPLCLVFRLWYDN
jgi:hypothetical protein